MDWLFGRKKSEAKVEDAKEATQVIDGFVVYPSISQKPVYPVYPSLPNYPGYQAGGSASAHHSEVIISPAPVVNRSLKPPVNPLDSVPFRLSSDLDKIGSQTLPPEVQRIGAFLLEIRRALDSSELTYNFWLERSVLRETDLSTVSYP